jgi:hypothetical protein
MRIDRRDFLAYCGGAVCIANLSDEAKADKLESYLVAQAGAETAAPQYPTVAEVAAQIETRPRRRGVGAIFVSSSGNVKQLPPMPAAPTIHDFYRLRFTGTANHCLQSANHAMKLGLSEEVILACLLHDTVQELMTVNHGWWGAQMYEPYVPAKVVYAIRNHQALRFYADEAYGYHYPDIYRRMFGSDYRPEPYIEEAYRAARKHRWYAEARLVTVCDLYAFERDVNPSYEQFTDIVDRHFKQPKQGLGFDGSPVAHMWRSLAMPDMPL